MDQDITWVRIDDDKRKLTVAVLRGSGEREPKVRSVENDDRALRRWVHRLERDAVGGEIWMCYEAGPNGFALKRRLAHPPGPGGGGGGGPDPDPAASGTAGEDRSARCSQAGPVVPLGRTVDLPRFRGG
jgi:hypothetical protein